MPTVCIMGLPMSGKSKLIKDLQELLPDVTLTEDRVIVPSIFGYHCGARGDELPPLRGRCKSDLYLFIDADPRVLAKRIRLYSETSISGSGLMKAMHKTRHDMRLIAKEPKNKMISFTDKDNLSLKQIADLVSIWINPDYRQGA